MHPHRQTVIDRAIAQHRLITDADVRASQTLRAVALDYVSTYKGHSAFVQDIAVKLDIYKTLTDAQMRGALNAMVREAREERELAASANADAIYIDLRSKEDKERDAAGAPPASASGHETGQSVPNGFYTVLIDGDASNYVTIRVSDAPDHFNAAAGTQIAAYLSGADNTSDYTGFAFIYGDQPRIWKKAANLIRQKQALNILLSRDPMIAAAEYVKRSNRCFVCNRPLTTPDSIAAGIGPVCREKLAQQGFAFDLAGATDAPAVKPPTLDEMIGARIKHTRQTRGGTDADHDGVTPAATRTREPASADVLASRQRRAAAKAAAKNPITREQAQADIDELFDY